MLDHFPSARWGRIRDVYRKWWNRTLDRPVINVSLWGADPGRPRPAGEMHGALWQYPLDVPAQTVAEHWLYMLLCHEFLGDSYPVLLPDYGAGVNAAFMGCRAVVKPETVWFEARRYTPPEELRFHYDPDEPVFNRIRSVYRAMAALFGGGVVMGMTHLNNGIDIVARFYDGVEMGTMLYDKPDEVKRLTWENHALMLRYLRELSADMGDVPGYTCWGNLFGEEPWMGAQSDFCAMIGPGQFREFILPELRACFAESPRCNFYHLDGPGQLPHLDMLCDEPDLRCIQWVPGDGAPPVTQWPEVYKKIHRAGKNIWLLGGIEDIEVVADQIGTAKGIYWCGEYPASERDRVMRVLEKFGAV